MKFYPNVLILRLRMPVSDDLHPRYSSPNWKLCCISSQLNLDRNFVTKIAKYERVVDIPNVPNLRKLAADLLANFHLV